MAHTIWQSAGVLQDEIKLDVLTGMIMQVVQETLQPVHAFIWMNGRDAVAVVLDKGTFEGRERRENRTSFPG